MEASPLFLDRGFLLWDHVCLLAPCPSLDKAASAAPMRPALWSSWAAVHPAPAPQAMMACGYGAADRVSSRRHWTGVASESELVLLTTQLANNGERGCCGRSNDFILKANRLRRRGHMPPRTKLA